MSAHLSHHHHRIRSYRLGTHPTVAAGLRPVRRLQSKKSKNGLPGSSHYYRVAPDGDGEVAPEVPSGLPRRCAALPEATLESGTHFRRSVKKMCRTDLSLYGRESIFSKSHQK